RKGMSLIQLDTNHIFDDIRSNWSVDVTAEYLNDQESTPLYDKRSEQIPASWHTFLLLHEEVLNIANGKLHVRISQRTDIFPFIWNSSLALSLLVLIFFGLLYFIVREREKLAVHRKRSELHIQRQQKHAEITLNSISDAVLTLDLEGRITYLNDAALELLDINEATAQTKRPSELFQLFFNENETSEISIDNADPDQSRFNEIVQLKSHHGGIHDVELTVSQLEDQDEMRAGSVITLSDITKEQQLKQELLWQAEHDALTGLYNRRAMETRLQELIGDASRGHPSIMFYMDLDEFKVVNDTSGHHAGDQLLQRISSTLANMLRSDDMLARLGGDEFAVLLPSCDLHVANEIASRMQNAIKELEFLWEDRTYHVGVSIGIVVIDKQFHALHEVLRAADLACYTAKDKGGSTIQLYTKDDQQMLEKYSEMNWSNLLSEALDNNWFLLYEQLIYPVDSSQQLPIIHELLLRMRMPDGTIVSPGEFLPAAERYGLMMAIDLWVVEHALSRLTNQQSTDIYSINISGQSIASDEFLNSVVAMLEKEAATCPRICFEITETAVVSSYINAQRFIRRLHKLGCCFALDDFGTGLSSFSYLKHFSVDYLKIDTQFIEKLANDKIDYAMVKSIKMMAEDLGIQTIAEGVQDEASLEASRSLQLTYVQGFAISEPTPLGII
ncbi:MAG: EAL domain-containing protein, partial [bacterium]